MFLRVKTLYDLILLSRISKKVFIFLFHKYKFNLDWLKRKTKLEYQRPIEADHLAMVEIYLISSLISERNF